MEHVFITIIIGFFSGGITYFFGIKAIESKQNILSELPSENKNLKEAKELIFSLIAGLVGGVPAIYAVTSQPKYIALFIGFGVWVVIAIYAAMVCLKRYPSFFENENSKNT